MKDLSEKENLLRPPAIGEIVEGKVIAKGKSALYLDLSPIGTGIIFGREFLTAKEKIRPLKRDDIFFAKIIDSENEDGFIELSSSGAAAELSWKGLEEKQKKGEIISVKILGANKGGLLAEIYNLPAFIPVSQLEAGHYPRVEGGDPQKILAELQKLVGQELEVKIFDLKPKTGEVILSEKAKGSEKLKEVLKNYKIGDVIDGEITGITDFGAFIKFGGQENTPECIEGLIHISELDWKIIDNPAEIVKVGQTVKVKIIDITGDKVSLSLKSLKKDPWSDIDSKFKKGDIVKGKITKLNPFGVFVQITPEIQGLCHISEFGTQKKMEETLETDKTYKFEILLIEPQEHRMSLKLMEK
ncbi:MAG: S1 RNA-binding domain-containing protein [bacterium]